MHPPDIQGSGYVVSSREAALRPFHDAAGFSDAVLRAMSLGDDADTIGAVCGRFSGACRDESGIPPEWLSEFASCQLIDGALSGLLKF